MITCEQLILGWAPDNLLGTDGFGPIAASPGWPLHRDDRTAGLGDWSSFLPEGSSSRIAEGEPAPFCAAYVPTPVGSGPGGLPGGVVLLSKVYLTQAARPGQYYVHALWDPTGRLTPADLIEAYQRGDLHSDDEPPPTGPLPTLALPPAAAAPTPMSDEQVTLTGHLVHAWLSGYPLIIDLGDREPLATLAQLTAPLPEEIARAMSFSTFLGRQDASPVTVAFAVFPFSPAAVTWPELVADRHHDDLGLGVLGGHVTDPAQLRAWARLRAMDLAVFRRGPGAATERAEAQRRLVDQLSDREITESLLPALATQSVRPVIAVPRIAELAAADSVRLADYDWAVGTASWTRLSDHLLRLWLTEARRPSGHLLRQATMAPDRFAAGVRAALGEPDAPDGDQVVEALVRWPDEHVEALVAALSGVTLPTGALLAAVLDRPEDVLRRVLRTHWPQLAEQADLGVLGKLLKPAAGRLFDRR